MAQKEINSDKIRILGGVKYQVVKMRCTCPCHNFPKGQVKHVRACCNGGYRERLIRIKE